MTKDQAIALMIRLEGGYVDNPRDPGGATKYGITQRTLDHARRFLPELPANVKDLQPADAARIYGATDWAQIRGDDLPAGLACLMLNSAVNQGEPTAVRLLQACVGVEQTGFFGPETMARVHSWISPYLPEQPLAEEFAARCATRYASLDGSEREFELGWFRRLFRVYTLATSQ